MNNLPRNNFAFGDNKQTPPPDFHSLQGIVCY
jgi:hypothetical protein